MFCNDSSFIPWVWFGHKTEEKMLALYHLFCTYVTSTLLCYTSKFWILIDAVINVFLMMCTFHAANYFPILILKMQSNFLLSTFCLWVHFSHGQKANKVKWVLILSKFSDQSCHAICHVCNVRWFNSVIMPSQWLGIIEVCGHTDHSWLFRLSSRAIREVFLKRLLPPIIVEKANISHFSSESFFNHQ